MFRNLLIPTDGSELATKAVAKGIDLAKETGAKVTLVTVTAMWSPWEVAIESREQSGLDLIAAYEDAASKRAERVLAEARKVADAAGVPVDTVHVPDRGTAEAIVDAAKAKGSDLIVMATHGRHGLGQVLLGSATAEVMHLTDIPVLAIR